MNADDVGPIPHPSDGHQTTVAFDVPLPVASDRYQAKRFHARRGMGEVWLTVDNVIGREVALKQIREKIEGHTERFIAEAQIAGQLEHPNIVPVHDLGRNKDSQPYYIMKFCSRTNTQRRDRRISQRQEGRLERKELALAAPAGNPHRPLRGCGVCSQSRRDPPRFKAG